MSGHYALAAGESLCHQLESPESRAVPRRAGNAGLGGNLPAEPLPGTERLSRKGGQPIAPRVYFKDGHRGGRVTSPPLVPRACPLTCWWPRLPPSPRPCCMDVNPDPVLPNHGPLLSPCLAPPVSGPMTGHTGTRGKHTQHLLSSQARLVTAIVTQWGRRFIPVLSPLNRLQTVSALFTTVDPTRSTNQVVGGRLRGRSGGRGATPHGRSVTCRCWQSGGAGAHT